MASGDSYRPDYGSQGRRSNGDRNATMYHFGATGSGTAPQKQPSVSAEFSFRSRQNISERPLLQGRHNRRPEITLPNINGNPANAKFQSLEDMTDSDDEGMDVSDADDGDPIAQKQEPLPKWTSAEIYTALPPPAEAKKKRDVVKLIRKARRENQASDDPQTGLETNDDFISFGVGGIDGFMVDNAPPNAPRGPKDNLPSTRMKRKRKRDEYLEQQAAVSTVFKRGKVAHRKGAILPDWQPKTLHDRTPWFIQDMDEAQSGATHGLSALHKEICDFYIWVKPRHFEHVVRDDLVSRLHRCLQKIEPGSQLHAFGSFASSMYLPTGDMDLVLLTGLFLSAKATRRPPPITRSLHKYVTLIRNEGIAEPGSVISIPGAKVPIIKFVDKITGLNVDLSFNNTTGIDANQTYQQWKTQYPGMQQVVAVVKHYLMIRGLGDVSVGGLGGFSLTCLVVSLLQLKPAVQNPLSLGSALIEFFNLYGKHFNRHDFGIRLDFPGYFGKTNYPPFVYNRDKPGRLAIIDPNKPDNNISGGTHEIDLICACFSDAYEILTEGLEEHNMKIGSNGSLLGDIIGGCYEAYNQQRDHLWSVFGKNFIGSSSTYPQPPPPGDRKPKNSPTKMSATSDPAPTNSRSNKPPARTPKVQPVSSEDRSELKTHRSGTARDSVSALGSSSLGDKLAMSNKVTVSTNPPNVGGKEMRPGPQISSSIVPSALPKKCSSESLKINKAERRANRLRELRPDISNIPPKITPEQAIRLGGYQDAQDMDSSLRALENAQKPPKNIQSTARKN